MNHYIFDRDFYSGTIGGTLLALMLNINGQQLLTSAVVAATGAMASFIVSVLCRFAWEKLKEYRTRNKGIMNDEF